MAENSIEIHIEDQNLVPPNGELMAVLLSSNFDARIDQNKTDAFYSRNVRQNEEKRIDKFNRP
jgi:hypothetical protein